MNRFLERFSLPLLARDFRVQAEQRRTYWIRALTAIGFYFYALMFGLYENQYANTSFFWYMGRGRNILDAVIGAEIFGIYLLVPAWLSGSIAGEKERQTLTLLLATRLGAWRILMEKYLAAMLRVGLLLILSLPILAIGYPLGGFNTLDLIARVWMVYVCAVYVGGLTLFCSCLCATMAGAYLYTYALLFLLMFTPVLLSYYIDITGTKSIDPFIQVFFPGLDSGNLYPFTLGWGNPDLTTPAPLLTLLRTLGYQSLPVLLQTLLFLLGARWVFVSRALNPSESLLKHVRQFLASGPTFRAKHPRPHVRTSARFKDLPERDPIAWRENRRTTFGFLLGITLTMLGLILKGGYLARDANGREAEFVIWTLIELAAGIFWLVAQGSGIFQREQARQTLDVLVTTPILTEDLLQQKLHRTWRLGAWYFGYFSFSTLLNYLVWFGCFYVPPASTGIQDWALIRLAYSLNFTTIGLIYVPLNFWLAFGISLKSHSQGKAMIATILAFVAWTVGPMVIVIAILNLTMLYTSGSGFGLHELSMILLAFTSPFGLQVGSVELVQKHPLVVFLLVLPGTALLHLFLLLTLRWISLYAAVLKLGRLDRPHRYEPFDSRKMAAPKSELVESSP